MTKNKKIILQSICSFFCFFCTLCGALLLTPQTTAKAEETKSGFATWEKRNIVGCEDLINQYIGITPEFYNGYNTVAFGNSDVRLYVDVTNPANMHFMAGFSYPIDCLNLDKITADGMIVCQIKAGSYVDSEMDTVPELNLSSFIIELLYKNANELGIGADITLSSGETVPGLYVLTKSSGGSNDRFDLTGGAEGLKQYNYESLSGQYLRSYSSNFKFIDENLNLTLARLADTHELIMMSSDSSLIDVNWGLNDIVQNIYKDDNGNVVYIDFYFPAIIKTTSNGNYITKNLIVEIDKIDFVYIITDPETVCPTVYNQVNGGTNTPGNGNETPGTNPGTNPGDGTETPGTNPGDNPGTNPGDDKTPNDELSLSIGSSIVLLVGAGIIITTLIKRKK